MKGGFTAFKFLKSFNPFQSFKKNAEKGTDDAVKACTNSKSKIAQVIESIGTLFKSVGQGISTAAKGIGTGISSAFRGIGQALKIANPVNILALGAAIGIVVASMTLLATQGSGVAEIISSFGTAVGNSAPFVTALGQAISDIVGTAITALANALLILSPVLPTIAASFAALISTGDGAWSGVLVNYYCDWRSGQSDCDGAGSGGSDYRNCFYAVRSDRSECDCADRGSIGSIHS